MSTPRYTKAQVAAALQESNGFQTEAARILGCSHTSVRRYLEKYPSLREVLEEQQEKLLDFAESKLIQAIKSGEIAAIIFYLKTKGRARGYVEKTELTLRTLDEALTEICSDESAG